MARGRGALSYGPVTQAPVVEVPSHGLESLSADGYLDDYLAQQGGGESLAAEKVALKADVVRAYRGPWHQKFCYCTQDQARTDPTCRIRSEAG